LLEPGDGLGEAGALRSAARADDRLGPAASCVIARELVEQGEIVSPLGLEIRRRAAKAVAALKVRNGWKTDV
jgi:hypothetical protein